MRIGAFEINEPLPELKKPHAITALRPWIDAGAVGTLVISRLGHLFEARELGKLARPGNFYDFTRYRPIMRSRGADRHLVIPNTVITCTQRQTGEDFVFFQMFEPHMFGEAFTGSVWEVMKKLGVQRYCLIGSMYDMVPHTRPLIISGGLTGKQTVPDLERIGVHRSNYEGPTTICHLISQKAQEAGIETLTLIVHLPQYTELDEDYMGVVAILQVLQFLYDIPVADSTIHQAEVQKKGIEAALESNPKLKAVVEQLENHYDARALAREKEDQPGLSPEVERFLKEMENRFKET